MMRIRKMRNCLLMLLAVVVLLGTMPVQAAGECSLRVVVRSGTGDPVANFNVELYPVARKESGTCELTAGFSELGITAQELLDTPDAAHADRVFQYIHAKEMDGVVKRTTDAGTVDFQALDEGIYLVLDRGDQAVAFEPFLVILPAEIDGNLERTVISAPKTSDTDTKTLMAVKLWDDEMDAAGWRPGSIEVTVLRDGTPVRKVALSQENDWQHVFYMLPEDGAYTVTESPVAGYQVEYVPVAEGYIVINTYVGGGIGGGGSDPQTAHVAVRKVWDDENNAAGKRPGSITVQLIEDGVVVQTAPLSEANGWSHTFTGLNPAKSYTVQEIAAAEYSATYAGNAASGILITNTYTGTTDPGAPPTPVVPQPEIMDIPVRVEWEDAGNAAGKRPELVTVNLIADGSVAATALLHPGNGWESAFSDVPADLSYTVWQFAVDEYTTTYAGNAASGFVITNTYTEGVTDPGVPPDPTLPVDPPDPVDPPEEPDEPSIPQTGTVILPVYLLMAAGVLLVLLGIVDLYRGRRNT